MMKKTTKNTNDIDGENLMRGATELSQIIFNFFEDNKPYQSYTMGIIGYATEILIAYFSKNINKPYDEISKEYRKYLKRVHKDIGQSITMLEKES